MNNRDSKGRFLHGNNIGVKFQKGNTYNMYRPPQYRYVCTNCGYCGQYHIDIGGILSHFANCKYRPLPSEQIQYIIDSVDRQYPNNVLNIIASDYDLSDKIQMASFFSKQFTELDRKDKKNNPLLIASLNYLCDFHGLGK
jgi:hypothetical protein